MIVVICFGDVYGIGRLIFLVSKMMIGSEFVVGKKVGLKDIVC